MKLLCLEPESDRFACVAPPLEGAGHTVERFTDAEPILEAIRARRADAVLVPYDPAGALLNRLRALAPGLPVIALGEADSARAATRFGCQGGFGYVVVDPAGLADDMAETLVQLTARAAARVRHEGVRRRALDEGLRLRKFHEDVLNSVGQGIVVIDGGGRITYRNPEAARILGEESQEDVSQTPAKPAGAVPLIQQLVDTLAEGQGLQRTLVLEDDEQKLFLDITTSLLRSVEGTITGAVAIVSDRSIEKSLEQQLFHSERLATLGSLLASIAHEINNTLTSVTGCAEMGLELAESADEAANAVQDPSSQTTLHELATEIRQIFDMVLEAGISAQTIANNMLQYSRQGRPAHRSDEDVNRLVQRTLEVLGKHLGAEKVDLHLDLDPRAPRVRVEPSKLQQALVNLVVNAVHALLDLDVPRSERTLRIVTRRDAAAGRGEIQIRDRGPGIPPGRLERIFQPFFTTKDHGTGLGLYITKRVLEEQGGSIEVESVVGEGTTFTLRLPLARR